MSLLEPEKLSNGLYIDPMFDATQRWCWSADIRQIKDESSSGSAWVVDFNLGDVFWLDLNYYYVRAVRSLQGPGAIACYSTNPEGSRYPVDGGIYVMGIIRGLPGIYIGKIFHPEGYENKDISKEQVFKDLCNTRFHACQGGCWADGDTGDKLAYGKSFHLLNHYGDGSYLDVCGPATCAPDTRYSVVTHSSRDRDSDSTRWELVSAEGKKDGDPVQIGDVLYLKNMYGEGSYLDTCGGAACAPSTRYSVVTNGGQDRSGERTTEWSFEN